MTVQEAERLVVEKWQKIAEQRVQYPLRIDDTRTTEFDWGWSFCFVPSASDRPTSGERYVIDRVTGISSPVGTKGLSDAVNYLMEWRKKRAQAVSGQAS